jgi:hypothetical protein
MNEESKYKKREKTKILNFWKVLMNKLENKKKELCKKYKVNLKPLKFNKYNVVYKFDNDREVNISWDNEKNEKNLKGNDLIFAKEFNNLIRDCHVNFYDMMERGGFIEVNKDVFYSVWEKENYEYDICNYAEREEDIVITKKESENKKLNKFNKILKWKKNLKK